MLRSTFCHLKGLRRTSENRLWQRGVLCWDDWDRGGAELVSVRKAEAIREQIAASRAALAAADVAWFLARLPAADRPRAAAEFHTGIGFLDIETDGMGPDTCVTTAVLATAGVTRAYIRGINLDELPENLARVRLLVTYHGNGFDLPVLRREFGLPFALPHLDLCPVLHAWNCYGGLKATERKLGLASRSTGDLDGRDAIRLWQRYRDTDDMDALRLLLRYNALDAVNLEPLLWKALVWSMAGYPLRTDWRPPTERPGTVLTPWGTLAL